MRSFDIAYTVIIALWLWLRIQETAANDHTQNETCLGEEELRAEWEDSKNTIAELKEVTNDLKAKLNESMKDADEAWSFVQAISMETKRLAKVEIVEAGGESKVCLETRRSFAEKLKMFLDKKRRAKKQVGEEINHMFAAFEAHEEEEAEHERYWLLTVSIVSTMILFGVLIRTHGSHANELQALRTEFVIERARCLSLQEDMDKIERARHKDEKKRVKEVEEPLLSLEGYDAENEASGPRLKRRSTWKDVVKILSDEGEIDIEELDSSLHDEEVYASVNEAA